MKIVSASRRTDIPAFYTEWLMNRLREGYARVPNPFNARQVSTVILRPESVACLLLVTKDPRPMLPHLDELERRGYRTMFQVTVTGLPRFLEPLVPPAEAVVPAVRTIAESIGRDRITWRFDPILLSRAADAESVISSFSRLACDLRGSVSNVIISFAREYRNVERRIRSNAGDAGIRFLGADPSAKKLIASALAETAVANGMKIQSCADPLDMTEYGVPPGKCVDPDLIRRIFGIQLHYRKDPGQRKECLCAPSVDLGIYGTCPHGCLYCYASCNTALARGRHHDPRSPSLLTETESRKQEQSLFPFD